MLSQGIRKRIFPHQMRLQNLFKKVSQVENENMKLTIETAGDES